MTEKAPFDPTPILEDRPLSVAEHSLINWLIERSSGDISALRSQLPYTRVVSRCRCGCPTIDIAVSGVRHDAKESHVVAADFVGETAEGFKVGVMLWTTKGDISGLEVYSLGPQETRLSLPLIDSLKPF